MDTHEAEIARLLKQLSAKVVELSGLSEKRIVAVDKLPRVKSQIAAEATILDDLKSVARNCERPNKRAKVTSQCEESSTTTSTAAFSALLAERESYRNHCEALMIKNQGISGLAAEAKTLLEKIGRTREARLCVENCAMKLQK